MTNPFDFFNRKIFTLYLLTAFIIYLFIIPIGCSSTREQSSESTSDLQKQIADLKTENAKLIEQIEQLQKASRSAMARAAELETQLTELREQSVRSGLKETSTAISQPTPPKNSVNEYRFQESYAEGIKLFKSRKYSEAESIFENLLRKGPPSGYEDNCYYWLGECDYARKKYKSAIEHFKKVIDAPTSEKRDDAQMMIGNCYFALGNKTKAREAYERLIEKYPHSRFVKSARAKLSKL